MPRKSKKASDNFWSETIDSPNDTYGNDPGYEDPLDYMSPEQIALLADYCNYLKAHDGYDPDNYEAVILEKEKQLFAKDNTKSNGPPPLYPDESDESEDDEDEGSEEEDIEEEDNDNSDEEN